MLLAHSKVPTHYNVENQRKIPLSIAGGHRHCIVAQENHLLPVRQPATQRQKYLSSFYTLDFPYAFMHAPCACSLLLSPPCALLYHLNSQLPKGGVGKLYNQAVFF